MSKIRHRLISLRYVLVVQPLFRRYAGAHHFRSGAGHHRRNPAGENQDRRRFAGDDVDSLRRHRSQPFRHDDRPRRAELHQGVRPDPVRLLDRIAGRARVFLVVQERRYAARRTGVAHRRTGCRHRLCAASGHRYADPHHGRHPVGRRDQHAGTGRRTTGLQRRFGDQRPFDRTGLCRSLSAGRHRHHLLDDLHPLCAAHPFREGGRGAGGDEQRTQEIRRQNIGPVHQRRTRRPDGGRDEGAYQPLVRHFADRRRRQPYHRRHAGQPPAYRRQAADRLLVGGYRRHHRLSGPHHRHALRRVGIARQPARIAAHPHHQTFDQRQEIRRPAPAHQIRHQHHPRQPRRRGSDSLSGHGVAGGRSHRWPTCWAIR